MSSRQSARLAGKPRRNYKDIGLSRDLDSDSGPNAHHRKGKKALARDSDSDGSHGEGSKLKRPKQTKKRRVGTTVLRQQEFGSLSTSGVVRKSRENTQVKSKEPPPAPKPPKHSGYHNDSTDLSEPPDTPAWTEFDPKQQYQPFKPGDTSDCDESALSYASCRRKESLECLKFVNHVLTEHSVSQDSTDCVVISSQFHERDEALLFENYKDGQDDESPPEKRLTEHVGATQPSEHPEEVSLPDVCTEIR